MTPQVKNDILTTYVHIACITWKALLHGEIDSSKGVSILLDCKQALAKYGYSFALIKQAGVVARKEQA